MTRDRLIALLVALCLAALGVWVAFNTYWDTVTVPIPMRGEAARNRYYALEHFAASLGLHTQEISTLRGLAPDAVLVVDDLGNEIVREPVDTLESWVDSGGRLIVWGRLLETHPALQRWSGVQIEHRMIPPPAAGALKRSAPAASGDGCVLMSARAEGAPTGQSFRVCGAGPTLSFAGDRPPAWSLSDEQGVHAIRLSVGLGEITVLGPRFLLSNSMLKRADHAELLAAAAGLRHEDTLLILRPARPEPLTALLWHLAAPAIVFLCAAMLALIWRHAPRFGPPLPAPRPVRRSLAEQIRANARFAWRTRSLQSLRAAVRRALDEAAEHHIAGYAALDTAHRADSLAAYTRIDAAALRAALGAPPSSHMNEHRAAITLMEVCRRFLLDLKHDPRRHPP